MSWPSEYSDTVLYGEREFIADSNVALRMLLGTRLDVLGTVYLNGELLSQSTEPGFANNTVSDAMLADMPAFSFKARASGSTGDPQNINPTQVTAMLDLFSATFKGLVPPPGTPTGRYLKDDGTWNLIPTFTPTVDGLVPAPTTVTGKYLSDNGWSIPQVTGVINPIWTTPTLGAGWIQYPTSQPVGYTRVGKLVIFKGLLRASSAIANDVNFIQLPSDCWPTTVHIPVAANGASPSNILYFSSPWLKLMNSTLINNFVSLDNVSFYVP